MLKRDPCLKRELSFVLRVKRCCYVRTCDEVTTVNSIPDRAQNKQVGSSAYELHGGRRLLRFFPLSMRVLFAKLRCSLLVLSTSSSGRGVVLVVYMSLLLLFCILYASCLSLKSFWHFKRKKVLRKVSSFPFVFRGWRDEHAVHLLFQNNEENDAAGEAHRVVCGSFASLLWKEESATSEANVTTLHDIRYVSLAGVLCFSL